MNKAFTKVRTADLTGAALDWAVAKCKGFQTARMVRGHGYTPDTNLAKAKHYTPDDVQQGQLGIGFARSAFNPSTDWAQGGPIIEREGMRTRPDNGWGAAKYWPDGRSEWWFGPTLLVAAMRCYVASKLGDEIEIPDALL
jgi:hypothetical protein